MSLWYISFATDKKFLGATVVEGDSPAGAVLEATRRGLNPGGEAAILPVLPEMEQEPDMLAIKNRLASREEMIAQGGRRHRDLPQSIRDRFDENSIKICQDCNSKN